MSGKVMFNFVATGFSASILEAHSSNASMSQMVGDKKKCEGKYKKMTRINYLSSNPFYSLLSKYLGRAVKTVKSY